MLDEITHSLLHNTIFIKYGLLGLFFNGMFSSFIPIPTEITISALLLSRANVFDVFLVLVVGSIIGGYIAYYIGYNGRLLKKLRKIPEEKYEQKSINMMTKYGWFTIIFLSPWIPILGDVVSIIAGTKKYNIAKYSIAMTTGKTVKAVAIVFFGVHFIHWLVRILH
ncbi:MAG: VTT domain-containing protein [Candidatus Nitrosotalea sp.]|nr:VTT domain-containing protein [Candidatus Nitrosotalea sp.]